MVRSWFKKRSETARQSADDPLTRAVREAMREADDETVQIVSALAGLLTCVAYADAQLDASEEQKLRAALSTVQGIDAAGASAIAWAIRDGAARIAGAEATSYGRKLLELTAEDFRLQVLELAVEMAAADDEITVAETNTLRQVASALGLTQRDYNAAQARFRDKLTVLKSES